ncbi:MAG: response regulator [Deltaproteobacteria bacterium]|nr:response regulator [Deltaproteobacteria bacterium]
MVLALLDLPVEMQFAEGTCSGIDILLVDDDETFREALAENFRVDGHVVQECGAPPEALAVMRSREFKVLVTDYTMPGGTGLELADRFYELGGKSVVLVTAYQNPIVQTRLATRRYVYLLRKPVDYVEVHCLVHRL